MPGEEATVAKQQQLRKVSCRQKGNTGLSCSICFLDAVVTTPSMAVDFSV